MLTSPYFSLVLYFLRQRWVQAKLKLLVGTTNVAVSVDEAVEAVAVATMIAEVTIIMEAVVVAADVAVGKDKGVVATMATNTTAIKEDMVGSKTSLHRSPIRGLHLKVAQTLSLHHHQAGCLHHKLEVGRAMEVMAVRLLLSVLLG